MKGSKTMSQLDQIRTKINDIDEKMAGPFFILLLRGAKQSYGG